MLQKLGRDLTEYISSNTMNVVNKKLNPFIWTYDLLALVLQVDSENSEVITVTLLPNQHWQGAQPGQYIDLKITLGDQEHLRSYSISTVTDQHITLTIKKVKKGRVSHWLHEHLKPGLTLNISQAFGDFIYKKQPKLLFICAGSGITPCFSLLQHLMEKPDAPDIQFFAQFSKSAEIIFSVQLEQWSKKIKLKIALSQDEPQARLCPENFKQLFPDFKERSIYLCGPEGFMQTVLQILEVEAYPLEDLCVEKFVNQRVQNRQLGAQLEPQLLPKVYFKQFNKQIQLTESDTQKSLLEIGLENGLNLEKGCQRGICGTCKLVLHEGSVTGNTLGQAVYICTAFPASKRVVLGT